MSAAWQWRHWHLRREAGGLAWLELDQAGSATNVLSADVMAEFSTVLDLLDAAPPRALVIASRKPAGFIAGADIEEFARLDTAAEARKLVQRGWELFARLAAVRYATLALIRGHCLGGGLELALACRMRIAVDEPATRLGLPEVLLGIVPGWGGMARLPKLIGPAAALDMMLTGKTVDARKAKRLGLVDDCVPARVMDAAARILALDGAPRARPLGERFSHALMQSLLRGTVARQARSQLERKVRREHYPAPYALIDIWELYGGNALEVPAGNPSSLEAILASPTARNLVRVFFLQERLKAFGKEASEPPVKRVHVIGAGVMGGDIAALCALRGMQVSLQDQSLERIAPAIARATRLFERRLKGDERAVRHALDRLQPDPGGHGVVHADLVIEAIFEDLAAKRTLFADVEARASATALLATNTSSLRVEDIASGLADPGRLVGIHFFNPVARMPLVEVVSTDDSDPAVLRRAAAFVRAIDKLPLPVRSAPGFLVNAVLGPYMLEALRCVEEGVAAEAVDAALLAFGMPMGPIELVDTVGLDIALAAGRALAGESAEVPAQLAQKVAAGALGKKSGEGYYRWRDGKPQKSDESTAVPAGLAERVLEPLYLAAARCVRQGVVADADLADAGIIFGAGFAPHTGGPLHLRACAGESRSGRADDKA